MIQLGGTLSLLEVVQLAQSVIHTLKLPVQILIPPEFADYFGLTPAEHTSVVEENHE